MKKLLFAPLLLMLIHSATLHAQDKIVTSEKYPEQKSYFNVVGKSFVAKKDNEWVIKRYGENHPTAGGSVFLNSPNQKPWRSGDSTNDRKYIISDTKFVIESIVQPAIIEDDESIKAKLDCGHNVIFCYYKAKFEDGSYGYMRVTTFDDSSDPISAKVANKPWKLQILPATPDNYWKKSKVSYDKYFKKQGVQEGLTQEQVLMSQWGKPQYKTRTSSGNSTIEMWAYGSGGMLGFVDGYLTQITSTE